MVTIAGGNTIATVGLTAAENTTLSNLLQSTFSTAPVQQQTVTVTAPPVVQSVTIGTFDATSITNTVVAPTTSGGVVVAEIPTSVTTVAGSVNNLVIDTSASGVVLQGSSASSLTGVVLSGGASSNTSLVVGNAGSSIIDGSQSTKNLTVVAGAGSDTIVSGSGNDQVSLGEFGIANGGSGADTIVGGTGSTTIGGGVGSDSIVAGSGGGVFIGEVGNDTLVAGTGKDIFIYRSGDGNDSITGFNPAQDTLGFAISGVDITSIISNATVSGGNTTITLPDGSTITLAGVTGINVNWFTIK